MLQHPRVCFGFALADFRVMVFMGPELCSVWLGAGVVKIGGSAFARCEKISSVYYGGLWAGLEIGDNNDCLLKAHSGG